MLTIAIPTYNRNPLLERQVRRLIPQLTSECQLMIVDNCSDVPVSQTLEGLLQEFHDATVQIVRNPQNIGLSGNLLRCFELCQSEYIWILGDDDPIKPDAIQSVLIEVASHPDCLYFNFSFAGERQKTFETMGLSEFINKWDDSANIMWISTAVYRVADVSSHLKFGYQYAFSILPHVAMLIVAIGKKGRCCFSRQSIIFLEEAATTTAIENHWSRVNFALGMPTIYDLPMPSPLREKLARKLFSPRWAAGLDLGFITRQLLLESLKHGDRRSTLYYFDQICARGFSLNSSPKMRAKIQLYRLVLLYPRLTAALFFLVKRKRLGRAGLQDRHERV